MRTGYGRACELLRPRDPAGAELLEEAAPAALAYLDFPRAHRVWIRTNNVQGRMNAEIKRRTRVVQVFPSYKSLVRLVGAVCCDQDDAWLGGLELHRPQEPGARLGAARGPGPHARRP